MQTTTLDRRGLISYLAITFAVTYTLEGVLIAAGVRFSAFTSTYGQLVVAGMMWVPALATVITIRFVTHEGFAVTNFRIGSWKPYLASALIIPALFILVYTLTALLGLGSPDWDLSEFYAAITPYMGEDAAAMPPPGLVLALTYLAALLITPFFNTLFALGEEIGWRGYLLPKLMPLGKPRAYLLVGIIWGLWHVPLVWIGFTYPGYPLLGSIAFLILTTSLSIYINEMTLHHRSSILAGWIHSVFNSQRLGTWAILFPTVNPLLGGAMGLVGSLVWFTLGIWQMRRFNRQG